MPEMFLIQSAIAHLGVALRLLDELGADIPAAHVDAALTSLQSEIEQQNLRVEWNGMDFSHLDKLIDEIYLGRSRSPRAVMSIDDTGE